MSTADIGQVETQFFTFGSQEEPMRLENGGALGPVTIAYETYGELSPERDNAVLVFHALTGSQHAAGFCRTVPGAERYWTEECQEGWWNGWIGPGRALDTNRYFVICANYLGGCYGSTGPASIDPATGRPYAGGFPVISASDIVDTQIRLLDHLGIECVLSILGASLGGMLVQDFALRYPKRALSVVPIGTGVRATALTKVLNFEQIFAIEEDPNFNRGDYYGGPEPLKGLQLARMIGHKTFISLRFMEQRAAAYTHQDDDDLKGYRLQDPLESYMLHQGKKFVSRFDANSYLRLMNVWQQFDLYKRSPDGTLPSVFKRCRDIRFVVFTIDSDVCFYPEEQTELVDALKASDIDVKHVTIHSEKGHDSFLLEPEIFLPHVDYLLGTTYAARATTLARRSNAPTTRESLIWHI